MSTFPIVEQMTMSKAFKAGTVIFREGELGDTMYVVQEGMLNILIRDTRIATVGPGAIIGEMALITGQPRSATAIAEIDCIVAPIDEQQFALLMQEAPVFSREVMAVLSERLRRANIREIDRQRLFELNIRRATLDDLPAIENLVEASVRVLSARDYSAQQLESALLYAFGADTPQLIADNTYFVAEGDHQIVGCGGWSRRKAIHGLGVKEAEQQLAIEFLDPAVDAAKMRAYNVHPQWSRRGIGRRILQTSENDAREAGFTKLELLATLTGKPLYAACGFKAVEQVDFQLPDGIVCPTIKMIKSIG
jgi:CRP-like cAMP-binding protein